MNSIFTKKNKVLHEILDAYIIYNGMPKKEDFKSISDFIIFAFANSRKVKIKIMENIDKKFEKFEDLE